MNKELVRGMVTVVVPAYNEPALPAVVSDVRSELERLDRPFEIIVVDDGSTLPTSDEIACDEKVRVIRRHVNRGYGASVKEGIAAARGEVVLALDGDGQHCPGDIGAFLSAMDDGRDAALGKRQGLMHSRFWRMPGKWLLRGLAQYLVWRRIPDLNCGFRAFRTELIRRYMHLCPDGFSFSTTSTLVLLSQRMDVAWVPLTVEQRLGRSTVGLTDGLLALLGLLRIIMMFNPLRVLLPPSALLLTAGVGFLVYDISQINIAPGTILLLLGGIMLFFFGLLADQVAAIRRDMS